MKFIMIVLAIRFVAELVTNKKNTGNENKPEVRNEKIYHPAEFILR
jgi:hypothetical protein